MGHSTSSGRERGETQQQIAERMSNTIRDRALAAGNPELQAELDAQYNRDRERMIEIQREENAARLREISTTENRVKSPGQISSEITQLNQYPSGTRIEVQDDNGNWATYTAHDEAYTGRNGRMLRRRRYSIVSANQNRRGVPFRLSNRSAPEDIAERPWRLSR